MLRDDDHPRQILLSTLRDHLYAMGPSTIAQAARATGLRPAQVSALVHEWDLQPTPPPDVSCAARCTLCRGAVRACARCRRSLIDSDGDGRGAPAPPGNGFRSTARDARVVRRGGH
jgi:hypothetical protein